MIELANREEVVFRRNGYDQVGTITGQLFEDDMVVVKGQPSIVKGEFTGLLEIQLDSGHRIFEAMGNLRPAGSESQPIRDRVQAATDQLEADRATMWHGGGNVVYTK